jgi:hypothetical protein
MRIASFGNRKNADGDLPPLEVSDEVFYLDNVQEEAPPVMAKSSLSLTN